MRIRSIFILAVSLAACAGCAKPKVWTPFTTPDGKVSVLFPGTTKQQNTAANGLTLNNYVCEFRNEAYLFSQTDLPPGVAGDYQGGVNGIAQNSNGKILSQNPITVNGHTGVAYELEVGKPVKGFATGRMFKINNKLYQIMAMGTNCRATNPDVVKFLGSLDLSKTK